MPLTDPQEVKEARAHVRDREGAVFDRAIEVGRQSKATREQQEGAAAREAATESRRKVGRLSVV